MPNVPAAPATPPAGVSANAETGWSHLSRILAIDSPAKLTRGAASRKRLRAIRRGR